MKRKNVRTIQKELMSVLKYSDVAKIYFQPVRGHHANEYDYIDVWVVSYNNEGKVISDTDHIHVLQDNVLILCEAENTREERCANRIAQDLAEYFMRNPIYRFDDVHIPAYCADKFMNI